MWWECKNNWEFSNFFKVIKKWNLGGHTCMQHFLVSNDLIMSIRKVKI